MIVYDRNSNQIKIPRIYGGQKFHAVSHILAQLTEDVRDTQKDNEISWKRRCEINWRKVKVESDALQATNDVLIKWMGTFSIRRSWTVCKNLMLRKIVKR